MLTIRKGDAILLPVQLAKQMLKTARWAIILLCLMLFTISLSALAVTIQEVPAAGSRRF